MSGAGRVAELERDSEAGVSKAGESWTILRMILWSAEYLMNKGVEGGRLDAEWLLSEALGIDRLQLYLQYDRPLSPEEREAFKPLLRRRAVREPLQYILGRTAFRQLELKTDHRVLIPRPETEVLVEEVLDWASGRRGGLGRVWDVGTGTGAVALSLAVEGACSSVLATDESSDALSVAADNVGRYDVKGLVELREGSLFEPLEEGEEFDVIVSNPPYVAEGERGALQPEVRDWEPPEALFAGEDGLDVLRMLVAGAPERLVQGGLLALECGVGQAESIAAEVNATGAFSAVRIRSDLTGRPRVVMAERGAEVTR